MQLSPASSPRSILLVILSFLAVVSGSASFLEAAEDEVWTKHVVYSGYANSTAVGADFTGDGHTDIITASAGKVRLLSAPEWRETAIYTFPSNRLACIHSAVLDVDGDGDPDYLGAHARGPVFWLENPDRSETRGWNYRVVDDAFTGIHCLLVGDVDNDGNNDLIVNNFEPSGTHADSILWFSAPKNPRSPNVKWKAHTFAKKDAVGGSHYMGLGDIDGDGHPDITCGAKGKPFLEGNWFAWWKNPGAGGADDPWKKFNVAKNHEGATNLIPADLNGDGKTDLFASRGHGKGVLWFEGSGNQWIAHEIDPFLEGPHCLVTADFDEDGDIDGATCAKDSQLIMLYENDGKGAFTNHVLGKDQAAYDIRAVDMDGDRDLDLLIAGQRSANVVWVENPLRSPPSSPERRP